MLLIPMDDPASHTRMDTEPSTYSVCPEASVDLKECKPCITSLLSVRKQMMKGALDMLFFYSLSHPLCCPLPLKVNFFFISFTNSKLFFKK